MKNQGVFIKGVERRSCVVGWIDGGPLRVEQEGQHLALPGLSEGGLTVSCKRNGKRLSVFVICMLLMCHFHLAGAFRRAPWFRCVLQQNWPFESGLAAASLPSMGHRTVGAWACALVPSVRVVEAAQDRNRWSPC